MAYLPMGMTMWFGPRLHRKYRNIGIAWEKLLFGDRRRRVAMDALMRVYQRRADLQETYPEAAGGNPARLAAWGAGVAAGRLTDSSYADLKPHLKWLRRTAEGAELFAVAVPWLVAVKTSNSSANPLPISLAAMQDERASAIGNHLMTLALLVREFRLRNIVELGTYNGNSTLALLEAARGIGGHVTSVDLDACLEAKERVDKSGLRPHWTFIQGNDLDLLPAQLPPHIDFLLIDTNHIYDVTSAELNKYVSYLRGGSWIALHDYVPFPGVNRAVEEFVEKLEPRPRFYVFVHQNGLALLRLEPCDG
jgi:predicted O-methyltransferase YrrM